MWSALLGRVDNVYASINWLFTPGNDRFFSRGYGDIVSVRKLQQMFLAEWQKDGMESWWAQSAPLNLSWATEAARQCEPPEIVFRPRVHLEDCSVRNRLAARRLPCITPKENETDTPESIQRVLYDVTFTSPLAEYLPTEVSTCHARFVLPDGPVHGIVVHAAATNTEDYVSRQEKLAVPLLRHGIASLLMAVPYYGIRRAEGQQSSKLLTVADYQLQSLGVIFEGVALLRWLHATYPSLPLGVTGISWGGAMAACIGVTSRLPVACIPCLGSTSPAVMVTGIINWQLDWQKLQEELSHTLEEAKAALEAEFRGITLKTLVETAPQPKALIQSMVQVSARNDYYVQPWEGQDLYDALSPSCHKQTLRWVNGGHVASFVRADTDFISAIVDAFRQME